MDYRDLGSDLSLLGQAAVHMRVVIEARGGFTEIDQPVYRQFQAAAAVAGILGTGSGQNGGVDGLPGPRTLEALGRVLRGIGLPCPNIPHQAGVRLALGFPPPLRPREVDEEPLAQEAILARVQQECDEAR